MQNTLSSARRCDKIGPTDKGNLKSINWALLPKQGTNELKSAQATLAWHRLRLGGPARLALRGALSSHSPPTLMGPKNAVGVKLCVYFAFEAVEKREGTGGTGGGGGRAGGLIAVERHKRAEVVSYAETEQERPRK